MRSVSEFGHQVNDASHVLNLYQLTKVPLPNDIQGQNRVIRSAHCGFDYTLLLTSTGLLLSAGNGMYGIHCNIREQDAQDAMETTGEFRVGRDYHRDTRSTLSSPGGPHDQHQFRMIPLELLGGYEITSVSAGEHHASAINMNGELWIWGQNKYGQCGIGKDNRSHSPQSINRPLQPLLANEIDKKVTLVACGGRHTLALTSEN